MDAGADGAKGMGTNQTGQYEKPPRWVMKGRWIWMIDWDDET